MDDEARILCRRGQNRQRRMPRPSILGTARGVLYDSLWLYKIRLTDKGLSGSMRVYCVHQPSLCKGGWFRKTKPGGLSWHPLYIIYTLYSTQRSTPVPSFRQETPGGKRSCFPQPKKETPGDRKEKFRKGNRGTPGGGISGSKTLYKETHGTVLLRICRKCPVGFVEKRKTIPR